MRAEIAHHQSLVAANGEDIRLVMALQHDAQRLVAAINRVAQHPCAGYAGLNRSRNHRDADLRFGGERHVFGNACRFATLHILDPVLRQIKTAVYKRMSLWARVAKENADLAVLDPAGRAAVLARDPNRVIALLEEAGFVENQHG